MTVGWKDTVSGVQRKIPVDKFDEVVAAIDHRMPHDQDGDGVITETDGELVMRFIEESIRTVVKKHRATLGQADDIITDEP